MLVLHETHRVAGLHAEEFAHLYRDGWAAALADGRNADSRLLWFLEQAHGSGPSYTFVSLTAVANLDAVAALHQRVRHGDLRAWQAKVDALRHGAVAKVLAPAPFSPMVELDMPAVPAAADPEHGPELPLFMEDTAWPHPGRLDEYLERAGSLYVPTLARAAETGFNVIELVAAFTPLFGAGDEREVVLWQRVSRPDLLTPLLTHEVTEQHRGPGTWMHDALEVRDRWESRLLRVAPWSPLG